MEEKQLSLWWIMPLLINRFNINKCKNQVPDNLSLPEGMFRKMLIALLSINKLKNLFPACNDACNGVHMWLTKQYHD